MLRIAVLAVSLALLAPQAALAQSVEGVWRMVEREIQGGTNPRIESGSQMQPSFLLYTEGYYALAFVTTVEPRANLGDDPRDADFVAAWLPYTSQMGTYELNDLTLTYTRIVAKNPNVMLPENATFSRNIKVLTPNRLETTGTNAAGVTTIIKYTRVENPRGR